MVCKIYTPYYTLSERSRDMKYTELVEKLQKQERNRRIMVKCGAFIVALGKDAIILNKILGLKLSCQKDKLCKAGIPLQSVLKYIDE